MSIYKRGSVYWYHFVFNEQHIQASTKQGNPRVARQIEAAHRTALAKGEVGIRERTPVQTLAQFCKRVDAYARAQYEQTSPKTWQWYRFALKTILADEIARRELDEITPEHIGGLVATLHTYEWKVASINSALRGVRRVLRLAVKWGLLATMPEVTLLRGENHRDRVISALEEAKYLAASREPLTSIATILVDSGLRPEECFGLRWEDINLSVERYGTLRINSGKTKAARRIIPLTDRVQAVLRQIWQASGRPDEGWVWPAPTKQGHVWHDSIRVQHKNALKESKVRPFVIYALRHTFLTRLGERGCNVWTLARIAGHSSIKMSERYVHPSNDAVLAVMSRLALPITG